MENQNYNHSDSEQLAADIEHIHKLAAHLLEHYSEISEQFTLPELHANAKLQMLIGILHELHQSRAGGGGGRHGCRRVGRFGRRFDHSCGG